jgi:1,4-dihydroxy-2-naphthoate octaprenyltransferase
MTLTQRVSVVVRASRPPFLLLTPAILFLAWAMVVAQGGEISLERLALMTLSALSAAIASNLLNEFFDFKSGLDQQTTPTPFSGGSGALVQSPAMLEGVKWVGLLCVSVSVWSGLALVAQVGWQLLLLGFLGVALLIAYTPIMNKQPWLCLFAPGLGYGLVMFVGAYWALRGDVGGDGVWLFPIPMLLVSALLLLNQFPDAQADAQAGRNHAVIAWGRERSHWIFALLHVFAFVWLAMVVVLGFVPMTTAWGMMLLPLSLWVVWQSRSMVKGQVVLPAMAGNVAVTLLTPVAIGLGLLIGT